MKTNHGVSASTVALAYLGFASALLLAGCAGGGGGSAASPAPQATADNIVVGAGGSSSAPAVLATDTTPVTTAGVTYPANLTVARPIGSDPAGVSASVTNNSAAAFDVTVNSVTDGTSASERFTEANVVVRQPDVIVATKIGGDNLIHEVVLGGVDTLSYTRWGFWARSDSNKVLGANEIVATLYGGRETPVGAVPIAGSATYLGITVGVGIDRAGVVDAIAGNLSLTANFSTSTVSGSVTGLINSQSAPLDARATMAGTVGGNGYAGTVQGTNLSGNTVLGSGNFDGKFFGPAAEETAGKWNFNSTDGSKLMGAFGARR